MTDTYAQYWDTLMQRHAGAMLDATEWAQTITVAKHYWETVKSEPLWTDYHIDSRNALPFEQYETHHEFSYSIERPLRYPRGK